MEEEYVLVRVSEYKSLLGDSTELSGLECAGVDNWSGYSEVDWDEIEAEEESTEIAVNNMTKYNSLGKEI